MMARRWCASKPIDTINKYRQVQTIELVPPNLQHRKKHQRVKKKERESILRRIQPVTVAKRTFHPFFLDYQA